MLVMVHLTAIVWRRLRMALFHFLHFISLLFVRFSVRSYGCAGNQTEKHSLPTLDADAVKIPVYSGADKSLARSGRKQANISVTMAWISFGALPCQKRKLDDSSRLDVVEVARVPDMLPYWLRQVEYQGQECQVWKTWWHWRTNLCYKLHRILLFKPQWYITCRNINKHYIIFWQVAIQKFKEYIEL